jgi:hypothetical protein
LFPFAAAQRESSGIGISTVRILAEVFVESVEGIPAPFPDKIRPKGRHK